MSSRAARNSHGPTTLSITIVRLAATISHSHYPNGDRAALKRWSPGQPIPLAFYRLWLRYLNEDLPPESQADTWMLIAWGLALSGGDAHKPEQPLGKALAEAQFAEGRLERLLSSPDALRGELFMAMVRFLAAKQVPFDWTTAAEYLLTRDSDARDRLHRRIARGYYRHLSMLTSTRE